MNKEKALTKTISKFTNLMDNSVLPKVDVETIINHYESLLNDEEIKTSKRISNIETNFIEDEINDILIEEDFWDGDDSHLM